MLEALVNKKYPRTSVDTYNLYLSRITQNAFHDIEDYMFTILSVVEKWAAATNASYEEIEEKKESAFLQGLSVETLNFMDLNGENIRTVFSTEYSKPITDTNFDYNKRPSLKSSDSKILTLHKENTLAVDTALTFSKEP